MSWREVGICLRCGLKELIDTVTKLCVFCEDAIEDMLLNALDASEYFDKLKTS
jgi:hypothetical protein